MGKWKKLYERGKKYENRQNEGEFARGYPRTDTEYGGNGKIRRSAHYKLRRKITGVATLRSRVKVSVSAILWYSWKSQHS